MSTTLTSVRPVLMGMTRCQWLVLLTAWLGWGFASQGLGNVIQTLFWIGVVPLVGLCFFPWVIETKGRVLAD